MNTSDSGLLPVAHLYPHEAVELAAALVASIAAEAGLQCLFIKGPAAVSIKARPPRASSDIDVLALPEEIDIFINRLKIHGWLIRPSEDGLGIPRHSHTLYHENWPSDIDLHFRFPGLEAKPEEAFAALNKQSTIHYFAGFKAFIPSFPGHVVIQITHALRNLPSTEIYHSKNAHSDYDFLRFSDKLPKWPIMKEILDGTDSWAAMRPFLEDAYPSYLEALSIHPPSEDWISRTTVGYGSTFKLMEFLRAPWRRKLIVLYRVFIPSREGLAVSNISILNANRKTYNRILTKHWIHLLKRAPFAIFITAKRLRGR
ncbi:nucleotidyltransferase family protein [Paeniglutamicibacter sp. Y32M11]|uniref:nucleotidyltransferase family protein n=1 Tax=Paeniglutamicibacter sp. Y32M11 TaxID=2853258 RepID=UPI001C52EA70|nr:nucleotidyltransferase family protein [Paeniglutamicibacter sp. Y32M11]QXQ09650.1 nucleotidyltransferase family protein [Paeniglutamicibacter sp. Y32M11]